MRKWIERKATMLFVRLAVWSLGMAMNVSGSKNMAVELADTDPLPILQHADTSRVEKAN